MTKDLETVVTKIFMPAFPCERTEKLKDAVQCKVVFNLTNSITALIGHGVTEITSYEALRKIIGNTMCEGIQILKTAGVSEVALGDTPSWKMIRLVTRLPSFISRRIFEKNFKKLQISSMARDLFVLNKNTTELDSINGYIVRLASSVGCEAPYNRAVYEIARSEFQRPDFRPLPVADLWRKIEVRMASPLERQTKAN